MEQNYARNMGSRSLESIVHEFEHSIGRADSRLDQLAWRLDHYELEKVATDDALYVSNREGNANETSEEEMDLLRDLLTELAKLKDNYASLRSELQEVHTMHADLTHTLRQKVTHVQDVFLHLRTRFAKHCKNEVSH